MECIFYRFIFGYLASFHNLLLWSHKEQTSSEEKLNPESVSMY